MGKKLGLLVAGILILVAGITYFSQENADQDNQSSDLAMEEASHNDSMMMAEEKMEQKEEETESSRMEQVAGVATAAYQVNTEDSTVGWYGEHVLASKSRHDGVVDLSEGVVYVGDEDEIIGGMFVIDMTSIVSIDLEGNESHDKLVGHLSSEDFFDVAQYPTAEFEITRVIGIDDVADGEANYMVTGDLTIKGITKDVTFPALITEHEDDQMRATAAFSIDRSRWDIRYGSSSFFKGLGDKVIDNDIDFTLDLVAEQGS